MGVLPLKIKVQAYLVKILRIYLIAELEGSIEFQRY